MKSRPVAVIGNKCVYNRVFLQGCEEMKNRVNSLCVAALFPACMLFAWAAAPAPTSTSSSDSWPYYGHDAGGMRYSPLTQISRDNVSTLRVATDLGEWRVAHSAR